MAFAQSCSGPGCDVIMNKPGATTVPLGVGSKSKREREGEAPLAILHLWCWCAGTFLASVDRAVRIV